MRVAPARKEKGQRISIDKESVLLALVNDVREAGIDRNRLIEDGQQLVIKGNADGRPASIVLLLPKKPGI